MNRKKREEILTALRLGSRGGVRNRWPKETILSIIRNPEENRRLIASIEEQISADRSVLAAQGVSYWVPLDEIWADENTFFAVHHFDPKFNPKRPKDSQEDILAAEQFLPAAIFQAEQYLEQNPDVECVEVRSWNANPKWPKYVRKITREKNQRLHFVKGGNSSFVASVRHEGCDLTYNAIMNQPSKGALSDWCAVFQSSRVPGSVWIRRHCATAEVAMATAEDHASQFLDWNRKSLDEYLKGEYSVGLADFEKRIKGFLAFAEKANSENPFSISSMFSSFNSTTDLPSMREQNFIGVEMENFDLFRIKESYWRNGEHYREGSDEFIFSSQAVFLAVAQACARLTSSRRCKNTCNF